MTKAYAFRRRLPDAERLLIEGSYHSYVTEDTDSTIAALRGVLDRRPYDAIALQNLAFAYRRSRRFVEAESLYAVLCATVGRWGCTQAAIAYQYLGKFDEAGRALDRAEATWPGAPSHPFYRAQLALARGRYDEAERIVAAADAGWRARGNEGIGGAEYAQMQASRLHGRQREVERHRMAWGRARRTYNPRLWPEPLDAAYWALGDAIWFGKDTRAARAALASALERTPLTDRAPADRGYANLAAVFAQSGDTARAREYIRRYQAEVTDVGPRTRRRELNWARGQVALAEGRWEEGISLLREWERETEDPLNIVWVGWAYDQAGQADSAAALYRRFLDTPSANPADWLDWTPRVLRRVGELYEARGDRRQAKEYYQRFVDLWADADLEFQPLVREIRGRIARL
jgi:tetratricopeptide (TPR) repeat protein